MGKKINPYNYRLFELPDGCFVIQKSKENLKWEALDLYGKPSLEFYKYPTKEIALNSYKKIKRYDEKVANKEHIIMLM